MRGRAGGGVRRPRRPGPGTCRGPPRPLRLRRLRRQRRRLLPWERPSRRHRRRRKSPALRSRAPGERRSGSPASTSPGRGAARGTAPSPPPARRGWRSASVPGTCSSPSRRDPSGPQAPSGPRRRGYGRNMERAGEDRTRPRYHPAPRNGTSRDGQTAPSAPDRQDGLPLLRRCQSRSTLPRSTQSASISRTAHCTAPAGPRSIPPPRPGLGGSVIRPPGPGGGSRWPRSDRYGGGTTAPGGLPRGGGTGGSAGRRTVPRRARGQGRTGRTWSVFPSRRWSWRRVAPGGEWERRRRRDAV
mmetsp:Transcript_33464/g.99702  ORF Transcript_33464/g.99702 Transcript_33464/m.99702 type:complete len:300 (+) Transcript_33464:3853-4752(+)